MVGYDDETKAYRCYNSKTRFISILDLEPNVDPGSYQYPFQDDEQQLVCQDDVSTEQVDVSNIVDISTTSTNFHDVDIRSAQFEEAVNC